MLKRSKTSKTAFKRLNKHRMKDRKTMFEWQNIKVVNRKTYSPPVISTFFPLNLPTPVYSKKWPGPSSFVASEVGSISISLLHIDIVCQSQPNFQLSIERKSSTIPRLILRAFDIKSLKHAFFTCARRHLCYWYCVDVDVDLDVDEVWYAGRSNVGFGELG